MITDQRNQGPEENHGGPTLIRETLTGTRLGITEVIILGKGVDLKLDSNKPSQLLGGSKLVQVSQQLGGVLLAGSMQVAPFLGNSSSS